jgi:hypothetical protein
MSVTEVVVAEREEKLRQIERLVASELLHGSESLCKLLRYLAEHCIDHPGATVKEYQIATELFKRPQDFDPRMDATVRVQTGRLRSKLAEYYAGVGAKDPWILEIPKGAYALAFYPRAVAPTPAADLPHSAPGGDKAATLAEPQTRRGNGWLVAVVVLSTVSVLLVAALVTLMLNRAGNRRLAQPESISAPPALAFLWNDFVVTPDEPWVIFSNAEFAGRPETGMHYFNPVIDKGQPILDHYTGVGEVLGIHELDRVFASLHHGLRVKRGRLLSLDDAKNNDLIFVGSPSENLSLRDVPTTRDFVFRSVDKGPRKGDLSVINVHPRPGENSSYISTQGLPILEDYAVIGLMPGLNPARWVMLLAGLTTIGTQAAVEYVSRPNTVEDLVGRIGGPASGKITPFECVIRVKVTQGVPVQTDMVALHLRY